MELTAIDLFSGLGGTSLGLQRAGFRVVAAVESHELAAESYRLNMDDVHVWEHDIRKVAARAVMEGAALARGELALLAACPPCQGFSTLRTLNGNRRIEDHRNGLLRDVTRFVRVLKPMTVLAENVPGLASNAVFDRFIDDLDAIGYKLRHEVVDVSQYGVPQRRRRLLIVASRLGEPPVGERCRQRVTVRRALRGLPEVGSTDDPLHDAPERRTERIAAMIRLVPPDGGSRRDLGEEHQLDCHTRTDGFKDIYGRMAWKEVAPTITGGCINPSKGRFLHPEEHRAITLREAALLQSFPADYQLSLRRGRYAAAELIGNALPPEFVRRHALALRHHIESVNGADRSDDRSSVA
ncbi:MAG: DNA cytosine methyltransferase [Acidimicrobiaceae bacterium]|nr:DNA cytosine methyltransferase [Acidimicrobiaceae bacterium]